MTWRRVVVATLALFLLQACEKAPPEPREGRDVTRIVTLAPSLAELVFAAGAGEVLVGVSAWSDYPPAVAELPVIGDAFMLDRERLALLEPDLLLAWHNGTPAHVIDELREAGYRVETLRTNSLGDVSVALHRIGELAGTMAVAKTVAADYERALNDIAARYTDAGDIRVFYQVSRRPLYTVNGGHYISELIALCGGSNIFADLAELAPTIDVEAVVARDPEVMLASTAAGDDAFADWSRWPGITANRLGNHFRLPADTISRASPRVVGAAESMCDALDKARRNRKGVL